MRLRRLQQASVLVALALVGSSCASVETEPGEPGAAATVYTARSVITMDRGLPRAEAVAVADGRILGVGSRAAMMRLAGEGATLDETFVDRIVVPGLIDQHLHPALAAMTLSSAIISIEDWALPNGTFPAARDHDDFVSKLRAAEAATSDPSTPLLSWGYHHYFHGGLDRGLLDSVSSTRPILVWHRSGHEFFLNSRALQAVGVTEALVEAAPAPVRAQIDLEAGHFYERGAFEFLLPRILPMTAAPDTLRAGLQRVEVYMAAAGVTTSAEPGGATAFQEVVKRVLGDPATPFRFYFIPDGTAVANAGVVEGLVEATAKTNTAATPMTSPLPKHVKLFSDGAIFSQLMQMQDGYTDGHQGEWLMERESFDRAFRAFWDAGYQIHVHQNGDAGLERVLDALEENLARNPRDDHRTTIVHFGFSTPQQVRRIAKLGAIVSANPYYAVALADRYGEIGIGPERADQMVRLGDVARAGVSFSLHSDMPMAPGRPLFLVWSAVNRVTPSGRVAGPGQRVSVDDALRAVTIEAAYSLRLEDEIGSIEPGKRANFTILEEDPFEVEPAAIKDIGIWGTVLEGRVQPLDHD